MSYNSYTFVKGYEERLNDFANILSNNPTASEIHKEWSNHVELLLEPIGWKAILKMSRISCDAFNIQFPYTVIVIVEQVNFRDLTCLVEVHEVEDDSVHLPRQLADVPLIDLYPTLEQDSSTALSLSNTAMVLDSCRFFYHHLWMPWDLEFDEDIPWAEAHLEGRLQLHFAIADRLVPSKVAQTVQRLVVQARDVQLMLEDLIDEEADISSARLLQLTELHNKLSQIRNEYIVYEKAELRKALLEREQRQERSQQLSESFTTLVLSTATVEKFSQLGKLGTQLSSDITKPIRIATSLQDALVQSAAGGRVLVTEGQHSFKGLFSMEAGGSISGLEAGVVITGDPLGEGCVQPLDVLSDQLILSSLTLHMTSSWNIIKVWPRAECCLQDVKLSGSSVTDGVHILPGARFVATACHFSSCRTALVGYPESVVTLVNCTFENNTISIELKEGCVFSMKNCIIKESSLYGIKLSMVNPNSAQEHTVKIINSLTKMEESGTVCKNNQSDLQFIPPLTKDPTLITGIKGELT